MDTNFRAFLSILLIRSKIIPVGGSRCGLTFRNACLGLPNVTHHRCGIVSWHPSLFSWDDTKSPTRNFFVVKVVEISCRNKIRVPQGWHQIHGGWATTCLPRTREQNHPVFVIKKFFSSNSSNRYIIQTRPKKWAALLSRRTHSIGQLASPLPHGRSMLVWVFDLRSQLIKPWTRSWDDVTSPITLRRNSCVNSELKAHHHGTKMCGCVYNCHSIGRGNRVECFSVFSIQFWTSPSAIPLGGQNGISPESDHDGQPFPICYSTRRV